jgi:hypothetical protein
MSEVEELLGVYDADGGIVGELSYVIGKLRGTRHCALCDVTHSYVRRKREWDHLLARLGVSFELLHLNECDEEVTALNEPAPFVAARIDGRLQVVLDAVALDELAGSVPQFDQALRNSLRRRGLVLAE